MEQEFDDLVQLFIEKQTHKEPQHLALLTATAFANPQLLIPSLTPNIPSLNESGLNIAMILNMYQNIQKIGFSEHLTPQINKVYDQISGETEFDTFMKSPTNIKYIFVVLFWRPLFTDHNHRPLLLRTLQFIKKGSKYTHIILSCFQDLPTDLLHLMVDSLNQFLGQLVTKQMKEETETIQPQSVLRSSTKILCYSLQLFWNSNKSKSRLPLEQFNNKAICDSLDPSQQFRLLIKQSTQLNFVNYPFLLDFNYKHRLMEVQSIYEQKMNIRKNMANGFSDVLSQVDLTQQLTINGLVFLHLNVHRGNILDDSMTQLAKIKHSLKSPLKVAFVGEQGADEGGVKNQFFQLVTKSIFNPYLDMFLPANQGRFYWPNPHSFEPPIRFQFVGILMGLALYNSVHLSAPLPHVLYKKLLSKTYEDQPSTQLVEDLQEIDPQTFKTLNHILTTSDKVEDLQLYFVIQLQCFGQKYMEQLVQDGSQIKVTNENREYYCMLYADYLLNKSIQKQFTAFKKGFYKVVSGKIIDTFQAEELRILVNGIQEIDLQQLQESTEYEGGYSAETPVVRQFWELLHTFDHEQKKKLMFFVTGTDRVPIDGLKSLNFLIQKHADPTKLPTAHTCFNVLLLPEYKSRQELRAKIMIILEHNQGFGLI